MRWKVRHPSVRPDSRRHHGSSRRIPGGTHVPVIHRLCTGRTAPGLACVGAFTAFYAASVACVQSDIKRVLAFSTISQIGFMIVALGVCTSADPHHGGLGYMAAMFHLFTHAMFKALLFLGAGSIIHAVHSNEMSAMGGLRKYMPDHAYHLPDSMSRHCWYLLLSPVSSPKMKFWQPASQYQPGDGLGDDCHRGNDRLLHVPSLLRHFLGRRRRRDRVSTSDGSHHTPRGTGGFTLTRAPLAMTVPLIFLAACHLCEPDSFLSDISFQLQR